MFKSLDHLGPDELARLADWLRNPLLIQQAEVWARAYHQLLGHIEAIVGSATNARSLDATLAAAESFLSLLCRSCRLERVVDERNLCALCAAGLPEGRAPTEVQDG